MSEISYDQDLFLQLNDEYASKPLVPRPPNRTPTGRVLRAQRVVESIAKLAPEGGRRVLEIGCGTGHLAVAVAQKWPQALVTGVDIRDYPDWVETNKSERVKLVVADITAERCFPEGHFDFAVSKDVWEHVARPYAGLREVHRLLQPGSLFYLSANLRYGPKASHRYDEVFFPWPHLLFTDDVLIEFYRLRHPQRRPSRFARVNRLAYAHYLKLFARLGFAVEHESFAQLPLDVEFYERFRDRLGRFSVFDLTTDFFTVVLRKRAVSTSA